MTEPDQKQPTIPEQRVIIRCHIMSLSYAIVGTLAVVALYVLMGGLVYWNTENVYLPLIPLAGAAWPLNDLVAIIEALNRARVMKRELDRL
jgi:hypothetical protein